MPSMDEVFYYLRGIWMLVRNDASGMNYLDITTRGVWRSFWSYFYALPALVFIWVFRQNAFLETNPDLAAGSGFLVKEAAITAFGTATYLLAVALLARQLGFASRFAHWLISGNWLGLALIYILVIPLALMEVVGHIPMLYAVDLLVFFAIIVATFRVYRIALAGNGGLAAGLIFAEYIWDTVLTLAIH